MKPKPWQAIAFYIVAVFLGGGLLAPLVYQAGHGWLDFPFARYVDRTLMLMAVVLLWPLAGAWGFRSWREVGVAEPGRLAAEVLCGLVIGLTSLGVVLALQMGRGSRAWHGTDSWSFLGGALVSAATVSMLEELLFRGVVQTIFIRTWGAARGIAAAAFIFALMHFIKVPRSFAPEALRWYSGLEAVGSAFLPLLDPRQIVDRFLALGLVGVILGIYFQRTGRLWLPIGLHAGWILALKIAEQATRPLTARGDLLSGHVSLVVLFIFAVGLIMRWRRCGTC